MIDQDDAVRARQRRGALFTAAGLGAFCVLMYAISIVKIAGGS